MTSFCLCLRSPISAHDRLAYHPKRDGRGSIQADNDCLARVRMCGQWVTRCESMVVKKGSRQRENSK